MCIQDMHHCQGAAHAQAEVADKTLDALLTTEESNATA